jgi:repressor LexA
MLSERQKNIQQFIIGFQSHYGFAPSYNEIGLACGFKSDSAVSYQVEQLEIKGYISRVNNKARAIRVLLTPEGNERERNA